MGMLDNCFRNVGLCLGRTVKVLVKVMVNVRLWLKVNGFLNLTCETIFIKK